MDVSIVVSLPILVAVKGFVRVAVFGSDWDIVGGDIDWSIWFEFTFDGETGDVTPLAFVADDERCRVIALVPVDWEVLAIAARVAIDGVDGDATKINISRLKLGYFIFYIHGEVKLSLGVDGEITETDRFPVPGPLEAIVFDDWGIISISYFFNLINYSIFFL